MHGQASTENKAKFNPSYVTTGTRGALTISPTPTFPCPLSSTQMHIQLAIQISALYLNLVLQSAAADLDLLYTGLEFFLLSILGIAQAQ